MDRGKLTGGKWYSQHIKVKQFIRERDNYTCQLCGAEGWQVDHIVPYAVSHDSTLSNLRVVCRSCNYKTRRKPKFTLQFGKIRQIPGEQYSAYLEAELGGQAPGMGG